jgi:uncharacterized protein (TIGR03084 family)
MMPEARNFLAESDYLHRALAPLSDADLTRRTLFKDWTIEDVVAHLHLWNHAAYLSLTDEAGFDRMLHDAIAHEGGHTAYQWVWLDGVRGRELVKAWHDYAMQTAEAFGAADPDRRLKWAGPPMKAATSITARFMETWAHGQEVYDLLGMDAERDDRIKEIAFLGVKTFGWAYRNRGREVPANAPYIRLAAPSGAIWEWNTPADDSNKVEGDALEFCKVVTQVRNVADTDLSVVGETARDWMTIVQCFAGPAEDPPAPGARYRAESVR